MQEFYYGQPQLLWDILCAEAEDLLREEELGTHLVAVYPAGNRIYGLESCSPGIFCLYVDSVEAIINPISDYHNQLGFKVFYSGHSRSPIIMADLFKWTQWLTTRHSDWRELSFLHAIPFGQHVIHEDPSINSIMEACHKAMKEVRFVMHGIEKIDVQYLLPPYFLYNRAMTTLYHTNKFLPNINPKWDKVTEGKNLGIELNRTQEELDKFMREKLLNGEDISKYPIGNDLFKPGHGYSYSLKPISQSTLKEISNTVMDFYRFQL